MSSSRWGAVLDEQIAGDRRGGVNCMSEEIVIKFDPPKWEPGVCVCPTCHGLGTYMDGSASISESEIRIRPATTCASCKGKGRAHYSAIDD